MTLISKFRALALSSALAMAPVLPSIPESQPVTAAPLTDVATTEQLFAQAMARPSAASTPFDAEALNTLLDGAARLTWAEAGLDPDTGAYRLAGAKLELLGEEPMTLFTADEILLWNADLGAIMTRLNGERLDETLNVFDRIEMAGLTFDVTDYMNAVEDVMETTLPEGEVAVMDYGAATMHVGRAALGGFTLHPWTYVEAERDEADDDIEAIRLLSAFGRSFSLDTMLFLDTTSEQSFSEAGLTGSFTAVYGRQLMSGYDRGNIGKSIQTGTRFSGTFPIPLDEDSFSGESVMMEMSGSSGYGAWTDVSFTNLLAWGEKGEMPPITERDLWSFGKYAIADTEISFDGRPVFRIGRLDIAADKFAWFLPERISISHDNAAFYLADMFKSFAAFEPDAETVEGEPTITEIADILERTGFGTLAGSGSFVVNWDSETGETLIDGVSNSVGLYGDQTRLEMHLPSYAELIPAFGVDGRTPDEEAFQNLFMEHFALIGGHYSLTDKGALDASAKLAIELAKFSGEDDSGMMAGFADSTPEAVRMFASGMLMFAGGAAASDIPQATGWIADLSKFITDGGTYTVRLAPAEPVTAALFMAIDEEAGMVETPGPGEIVDLLGLTMTHIPAGGTEAP